MREIFRQYDISAPEVCPDPGGPDFCISRPRRPRQRPRGVVRLARSRTCQRLAQPGIRSTIAGSPGFGGKRASTSASCAASGQLSGHTTIWIMTRSTHPTGHTANSLSVTTRCVGPVTDQSIFRGFDTHSAPVGSQTFVRQRTASSVMVPSRPHGRRRLRGLTVTDRGYSCH
jgi:hypothetical protein